ncbi:MAG: hypothetical protein QOH26_1033 [Actinomycetota bacterium]|nr:hypothetical protein [Actinomycetota bacterium]
MPNDKFLHIYLNDHLAASVAGVELARRAASSNEGNPFGDFLKGLADEIDEDRGALEDIMDSVGAGKDHLKQGAAWFAEKLGRLKLNGQLVGYSDLSRLIEFEGLSAGVEAKIGLWRSLRQLAPSDARLDAARLDDLIRRGDRQRDELEGYRLEAAEVALAG